MIPDFDVIIVGSGPAGVSAAFPLVKAGLRVVIVDGGRVPCISPPASSFLTARAQSDAQWKWMIGQNFHALRNLDAVSPKLRVPTHGYAFEDFEVANRINAQNFVVIGSLATGGLSNAWGCGVARLSTKELSDFPFGTEEIKQSYESVVRRIGVSGGGEYDELSDYFGLDEWSQPAIQMDAKHSKIYKRYEKCKVGLAMLGFRLGRSRVAALSADHGERKECDLSGNCLYGCYRQSLYSAANELTTLLSYPNFRHVGGFVVEEVVRSGTGVSVNGRQGSEIKSMSANKVVLAAGTLATTGLALRALKLTRSVPLLSCPTAAFLLWLPSMLGVARQNSFGLGQLSFALTMQNGDSGFGSTFGTTGIPLSEFAQHIPLSRRYGIDLLRVLLSSCLVGNIFLSGHLSNAKASLRENGSLLIEGGFSDCVPTLMADAEKRLRKAFWKLGSVLLPMSFTVGLPGCDIHYAATLPMRENPDIGETDAFGELFGFENVHVVDGACLSALSEKSHTLTIMANADRIGTKISAQLLSAHK